MKVVFRTDASLKIGIGHVMRCLTLADALKERSAEVQFICRKHIGNLITYIESKGYLVHTLEVSENTGSSNPKEERKKKPQLFHANWLGATQEIDAHECKTILQNIKPDWLVVDHYAIDTVWQEELKGTYKKLMVIDDLADRQHQSDLLLDQTYGRESQDYQSLVPAHCQMLLGSQYALLRPEFSQWREFSLKRREQPEFKKLLISMGGVDKDNVTGRILETFLSCKLQKDLEVTVVMGATAPHLEEVKTLAKTMPFKTQVKSSVSNMAEIMANSDLAIGAAGATTWERCCLGLPSIQVVVAENQLLIAKNLRDANIIKLVDTFSELPLKLKEIVKTINKISLLSSSITDGYGRDHVCDYLISDMSLDKSIRLKPVNINDCEYAYSLQTIATRKYSRNPDKPKWDQHVKWFNITIDSETSVLFVVMLGQQFVGILRLDNIDEKDIEISIIVAPEYSGRGIAKKSLKQVFKLQPKRCFIAAIHKENIPSQRVFEKIGFKRTGMNTDFLQYAISTD